MILSRLRCFAAPFVLSILLVLTGCTATRLSDSNPAVPCITVGWPWEESDLRPDPALRYGVLDNGLRYLLLANHEPADRVAMFLDVQAGAIQERDGEQGYAHFLEHMLFNGTTHYPPGTLVEYFQSIGMEFGADTNAHTGFGETVYKLMLPSGRAGIVADGLQVMADYARGALLLEQEVEQERGVILAEKRSRDTVEARVHRARRQFLFRNTLIAERDIIGTEETIGQADAARLRRFYDTWYRPENMFLVVVGDTDLDTLVRLIRENLGGVQGAAVPVDCPEPGRVADAGQDVLYLYEPDLGYTDVAIETTWNVEPIPDTLAWETEQLRIYLAASMLDNRLQDLLSRPDSPMTSARVYAGVLMRRWAYGSLGAHAKAGRWKETLNLLENTLRQAIRYGFLEEELARVKQELMTRLKIEAKTAASRNSFQIGEAMVEKLNRWEVILSPQQDLDVLGPMIEQATLSDVQAALRQVWEHERRAVQVVGSENLGDKQEAAERIAAAFQEAMAAAVAPWSQEAVRKFPYLDPGGPGEHEPECTSIPGIGAETCTFANGTRLHLKKTDFQPNQVIATVHFGEGQLSEPVGGLAMLAEAVVRGSGVGRMNREALTAALAGTSVAMDFQVGEESFSFRGNSLSEDLELLFHLFYTCLHDPAFRSEAFERSRERFAQMYDQLEHTVEGMMDLQGERFLAGGDRRYGLPSREEFMRLDLQQIETWLRPVLRTAGLEINVVGDFDREEVIAQVGRFFGKETRDSLPRPVGRRIRFPGGETLRLSVETELSRGLVVLAWPTDDMWDISRTRRTGVLASVLADRVRLQLRETLGAVYSPLVYNRPSRIDPGFGLLRCQLLVAPGQADLLARTLRNTAAELAAGRISEDELRRALEPTLVAIRDQLRSNEYWLETVLSLSSRHPDQVVWPRTISSDYAAITTTDLEKLARRYLRPERAAQVVILPASGKPAAP